jgi:hypothetical protein
MILSDQAEGFSHGAVDQILTKKKDIEHTIAGLKKMKEDLSSNLNSDILEEDQILELKGFLKSIKNSIKNVDFITKQRIIELIDLRGKLAIENNEKVVYLTCKIGKQKRSLHLTSHSLNIGEIMMIFSGFQQTDPSQ